MIATCLKCGMIATLDGITEQVKRFDNRDRCTNSKARVPTNGPNSLRRGVRTAIPSRVMPTECHHMQAAIESALQAADED